MTAGQNSSSINMFAHAPMYFLQEVENLVIPPFCADLCSDSHDSQEAEGGKVVRPCKAFKTR